jgi:hypothetical protein
MDESGTHDNSPVVVVGAYVGKPSMWRDWTKEWNRTKKPINVFHAVDCANLVGEFKGWDKARRDAYCARLLPVIPRHNILGIAVGIQMDAFRREIAPYPELREMFGTPYTACFQWVIETLLEMLAEYNSEQRVAFFHECNDYQGEALKTLRYIQDERKGKNVITLAFGGKEDYVPLQAADVLAYEANHLLRDPKRKLRRSWQAIDPDEDNHRIRVRHYGEANMKDLISTLGAFRRRLLASGWDGKIIA